MVFTGKYFSFFQLVLFISILFCPAAVLSKNTFSQPRNIERFLEQTRFAVNRNILTNGFSAPSVIPEAELNKIIAPDGATFDQFGTNVDIEGDTVVIGAPSADITPGVSQGAAYVYFRTGDSWFLQTKLMAFESSINEMFGISVAISGNTIIVGAPAADIGNNSDQGTAYIFVRNGATWSLQQKLIAADGRGGSQFGNSVAIDGDTVVIGSFADRIGSLPTGSAYVYTRSGETWMQQAKLFDSNPNFSDEFGYRVAVDNDTAVVSARFGDVGSNTSQGVVCVFKRTDGVWAQQARLFDANGGNDDLFGVSVAMDGETILVGSTAARTGPSTRNGMVYAYVRSGDAWSLQQRFNGNDTVGPDRFGISVDISGDTAIVGADLYSFGNGTQEGAAYIFIRNGANWSQQAKLLASDAFPADRLGGSVAVSGNRFLVGSPGADINSHNSQGAAYFFIKPTFAPDLQAASDTGLSNSDNITTQQNLSFDIGGVTPGATIELLRSGMFVSSVVAAGNTVTLTDSGLPANGVFQYTARQIINGEASSQSEITTVRIDNTPPTVTINQATGQFDPTSNTSVNFAVVFDESVTGFDAADVSLTGSTINTANTIVTVTGSGAVYNVSVTNITADNQTITASILPLAATDAAGNQSTASTSTDNTITVDNVRPQVTINQAAGQSDPTNSLPLNFTVVFSEPVTGFNSSDISLIGSTANTNGAVITITGSGLTYNVAVSNIISNGQRVQASVQSGGAQDTVGNGNQPSTSTDNIVTLDNAPPTVTINQSTMQIDPTAVLPVNFMVFFNEPVTGFDAADVSLAGSTANIEQATITVTGSGTSYNVAVGGNIVSNGGFIQARILSGAAQDALGNPSLASTSTDNRITFDNVAPTVTINQTSTQPDPTNRQPVAFTAIFSESVTGFNAADITLAGSTANVSGAVIQISGSGSTYTITVRNITSSGLLRAGIVAGAAFDIAGNTNSASTSTDNTVTVSLLRPTFDFDGDGKTDISIYRPSVGEWWYSRSSDGQVPAAQFGSSTDKPVPADFSGDGKTDIAFWRPSTGDWFILRSEDGSFYSVPFGTTGDVPQVGDFDADGKADLGVFRPSTGEWFISKSSGGTIITTFGTSGDQPVPADFDGDGKTDIAIFRPSDGSWWYVRSSDNQFRVFTFGVSTDKPVQGDYTGDGKADIAIFRPSTGEWFFQRSEDNSYYSVPFGATGDVPTPGDFDGDGKFDTAVFRPSGATWYINRTTAGLLIQQFGLSNDSPIPGVFVP
jgi:hypothetical protein